MNNWTNRTVRPVLLAVTLIFLCVIAGPAIAAHGDVSLPGSNFEIDTDANLVPDHADPSEDWEDIPEGNGEGLENRQADTPSGPGDNAFGQGTKEDTPVPSVVSGSIPPNKSDLKTFGVYVEVASVTESYLHLFWHRVQDPSGTTNMDFEFNQSETISANGVTPVRMPGDLLIQYDLANGGTFPELFLSRWIDGSDGETGADCEASNKLPCWDAKVSLTGAALATGSINSSPIANADSDGLEPTADISPRTFGEASIDFGELSTELGGDECFSFGSAYLKSRSSDSFSSALKDFIAPIATTVSNCASLKITKQDQTGALMGGVQFDLYLDNPPTGTEHGVEDTYIDSCTTSNVMGSAFGMCVIIDLLPGDYWVVEPTIPTGHTGNGDVLKSVLAPNTQATVTITNNQIPATINVHKEDDDGADLAGAQFTLYNDIGVVGTYEAGTDTAVTPAKTCTTDADGDCTISNILPPGDYCVVETITPTGHDTADAQCVSLALDATVDLTFVDDRQPATINIHKEDDDGADLAGAQFTLYDDVGVVGTYEAGTDTAVTPAKTCTTDADGDCTISNILPPGNYCVVETITPTGHDTADPQCVSLALNDTVDLTFVDDRQPATINIHKEDDDTPANDLQGAQFTLYNDIGVVGTYEAGTDTAVTPAKTCTTDADGDCTISNILPPGNYCVVETVTPTGYDTADPQCVSLALNDTVDLTFVDPRKQGTVSIHKEDDAGADLEGATFTLYHDVSNVGSFDGDPPDTTTGETCTTDANGDCTISNVTPGDYCVDETTVPTGYHKASAQCFNVAIGDDVNVPLTFVNPRKLGAIKITKTRKHAADGSGDYPHSGVDFTITGGELPAGGTTVTTDANGIACLDGLVISSLVGDYTVEETVPGGYLVESVNPQTVTVTNSVMPEADIACGSGNENGLSFSNIPLTNITVSVDSQVDGGTASTINCDDGTSSEATTGADGDGSLTVMDLQPGTYTCIIVVDP